MDRTRRLAVSLALNLGLVVAQIAFGITSHSTGLLADAGHNLTDVGALALSLAAVRLVLRPAGIAVGTQAVLRDFLPPVAVGIFEFAFDEGPRPVEE